MKNSSRIYTKSFLKKQSIYRTSILYMIIKISNETPNENEIYYKYI
jgi:hypothetical protein